MAQGKIQASGLIQNDHVAEIGLMDIPTHRCVGSKLFSALTEGGINLVLVVHLVDREETDHILLCVERSDMDQALDIVQHVCDEVGGKSITSDPEVAVISLFNLDFRERHGVVNQVFQALGEHNIEVRGISTSLSTVSCIVRAQHLDEAVHVLREAFMLA